MSAGKTVAWRLWVLLCVQIGASSSRLEGRELRLIRTFLPKCLDLVGFGLNIEERAEAYAEASAHDAPAALGLVEPSSRWCHRSAAPAER